MADENSRSAPKKSGGNRRKGSSETPRPTMAFRVHPALYEQIKGAAEKDQLTITEEVERSLSFKYDFARDAHDELFMRSIKSAYDMAEEVAGARWFESERAARLLHTAVSNALNLLVFDLGPDAGPNFTEVVDSTGAAIGSMAVNKTAGFGMTEARQRYDAAVESYKHFDRQHYTMTKALSEAGDPLEWATRPLTDEELAGVLADGRAKVADGPSDPAPLPQADAAPAPKRHGRPRKAG